MSKLTNALVTRMSRAAPVSRKAVSSAAIVMHKAEAMEAQRKEIGGVLWRCCGHGENLRSNTHFAVQLSEL